MIIWKPVLGFEGFYEVSQEGQIRSIARQHPKIKRWMGGGIVKPILGSRGYFVINLTKTGVRKQLFLHKIVLEAFIGLRPIGYESCHNDGNPLNCRIENLRWDTKSNNHQDKKKHGTWQVGEKANNVKLTNLIVLEIRSKKLTASQAVKEYGLSLTNAKRIVNFQTWKHL
jgi:hypothetical protein